MGSRIRAAIGAALALSIGHAFASNWKPIGYGQNMIVFVDSESIKPIQSGYMKAWFLNSYAKPQSHRGKKYRSTKELVYVGCESTTMAIIAVSYYKDAVGQGEVVDSYDTPAALVEYSEPPPDSIGEAMVKTACGR